MTGQDRSPQEPGAPEPTAPQSSAAGSAGARGDGGDTRRARDFWDEWAWPEDSPVARADDTRPIPLRGGAPNPYQQPHPGPSGPPGGPSGPFPGPPPSSWVGVPPPAREPRPPRRGPTWPLVAAVAAAAALVAGGLGGLVGGWVGERGGLALDRGRAFGATPTPGSGATERPSGSVANIAANALPSVVTIRVHTRGGDGTGSGFVLDRAGHVITNNHVVAEASGGDGIVVQLANGRQLDATLVGRDASYDLAVLDVGRNDLTPLDIGSSGDVVVGDPVIAVGAPLGLESTVTTGIVSALDRPVSAGSGTSRSYINAIQTDAAINPGNSGGPLLDMDGKVVGVNSAIAQLPGSVLSEQSGSIGLGFAIPSDQVRTTAAQLIRTGSAVHPVIGVVLDLGYDGEGVRILGEGESDQEPVTPGGPAAKAGLRPGDVIVGFEGKPVTDADALVVAIRAREVGDTVRLTVRRGGKDVEVTMTLQGSTG